VPASAILDVAMGDWRQKTRADADDEAQRSLHAEVETCLGILAGRNPRRAETARDAIRKRLRRAR